MRMKSQTLNMQVYFKDPDFWVFLVSLALAPLVLFNIL